MMDNLCFLFCAYFRREAEILFREEYFEGCSTLTYPSDCARTRFDFDALRGVINPIQRAHDDIFLMGGTCLRSCQTLPDDLSRIRRPPVDQCFEMVAPPRLVLNLIEQGAYIVTPGWLKHWAGHLKTWEFTRQTARQFFRESVRKITLLDTEVDGESARHLEDFSRYLEIPSDIVPVGMDYFRLYMARLVSEARREKERAHNLDLQVQGKKEISDYVMAFDLITTLTNVMKETEAVSYVLNLFSMLFAPEELTYLPVDGMVPGTAQTLPGKTVREGTVARLLELSREYTLDEEQGRLTIRISHQQETYGILDVAGVAFPQYWKRYLSVALTIGKVCGLALANARSFEKILRTENMLAAEKERLTVTLHSIGDGVVATDTNGRVLLLNRMAELLTGWEEREALGRPIGEVLFILHEETRLRLELPVQQVLDTGKPVLFIEPALLKDRDGVERPIADSCAPIFSRDNELIGTVMVFRNITSEKVAEGERIGREKLQGVVEMAGAAAHELNQPLQIISGYAELLLFEKDSIEDITKKIREEVARMGRITWSLTNITRYETKDYINGVKIVDIQKSSSQEM